MASISAEDAQASLVALEKERQAELRALLKNIHKPLRKWYRSAEQGELKKKHGRFPLFWQDLLNWEPWALLYKSYLQHQEKADVGSEDETVEGMGEHTFDIDGTSERDPDAGGEDSDDGIPAGIELADQDEEGNAIEGDKAVEPKRRRKSRFSASTGTSKTSALSDSAPVKRKKSRFSAPAPAKAKKSRFSKKKSRFADSTANAMVQAQQILKQQQAAAKAAGKLKELDSRIVMIPALMKARATNPERSPSPPPSYDCNGKRTNGWDVREHKKLMKQREGLVADMIKSNPFLSKRFEAAQKAAAQRQQLSRKLFIPAKEYPEINFKGRIIGARGSTHRKLQEALHCRIEIRGRGSRKANAVGNFADENEDLHVLISGDNIDEVDKAEKVIAELLVPDAEVVLEHQQLQFRELALINGTLRDDQFCHLCGEKGHRQFECPTRNKKFGKQAAAFEIRCKYCGETSHVSRDCRMRQTNEATVLDKEYLDFMKELGEEVPEDEATGSSGGGARGPNSAPGKGAPPRQNSIAASRIFGATGGPPVRPPWQGARPQQMPRGPQRMPPRPFHPRGPPRPMMRGPPMMHHPRPMHAPRPMAHAPRPMHARPPRHFQQFPPRPHFHRPPPRPMHMMHRGPPPMHQHPRHFQQPMPGHNPRRAHFAPRPQYAAQPPPRATQYAIPPPPPLPQYATAPRPPPNGMGAPWHR